MKIYTSRYSNKNLAERTDLVKIGISLGNPRFPLRYVVASMRELAPTRDMLHMEDEAAYCARYRAILDHLGVDLIRTKMTQLGGGKSVALLCFEDVRKPGQWCHRTMLGEWLEENGMDWGGELETCEPPVQAALL